MHLVYLFPSTKGLNEFIIFAYVNIRSRRAQILSEGLDLSIAPNTL